MDEDGRLLEEHASEPGKTARRPRGSPGTRGTYGDYRDGAPERHRPFGGPRADGRPCRIIEQKGYTAVAAEADSPDAHRVSRYVRGLDADENAEGALTGSSERLFHDPGIPPFLLRPRDGDPAIARRQFHLERAMRVISLPQTERWGHCFDARLSDQFDAAICLDEPHAPDRLERHQGWERGDPRGTYPSPV